jgi:VanZ family protein
MKIKWAFILFCFYSILLLIAAIIPSFGKLNNQKVHFISELKLDYLIHFLAYLSYFLLIILFDFCWKVKISFSFFVKISVVLFIFSIFTELIQLFLTYRTFNPMDLLSNLGGVVSGIIVYIGYYMYIRKN